MLVSTSRILCPPNDPHKKGLEAFAEAFKAKYGKLWNWNGGERAYDVVQLVAIALGKAGPSPRRQKIRDAAETICGYVGLQSTYCYSPSSHQGATTEAFIWATIKGGKHVYHAEQDFCTIVH